MKGQQADQKTQQAGQPGEKGQQGKQAGQKGQQAGQSAQKGQSRGQQAQQENQTGQKGQQAAQEGTGPQSGPQQGDQKSAESPTDRRNPEGGGQNPNGGGGDRPGGDAGEKPTDTSKPSPRAESPPSNAGETVAPDVPQTELVLRKLEDLIKNNQVTPELEKETGMSRDEMDQFVKKFRKKPMAPAREGREIKVKPEEQKATPPKPNLSELTKGARVSSRTIRERGSMPEDQIRDNVEGGRSSVPPEIRSRYEAYKSSLSRLPALKSAQPASATGSGGR